MNELIIAGESILPGEKRQIQLPVAKLYTDTEISIPIFVARSKKPGPVLMISAAIHGDELNGIEIIKRLISKKLVLKKGTLIAVPMVNVYGVLNQNRYMPDRRDLNRSFPGTKKGSLAGRVANLFLEEVVSKCDYGIDIHTGAIHRSNLPQIRADLDDEETLELAKAFGAPVILNANLRDGSLRNAAKEIGTKILLYEAGEALRFDELSIRIGIKGIKQVLKHLGMSKSNRVKKVIEPFRADKSLWVRATDSGIINHLFQLGDHVRKGQVIAEIHDPFGQQIDVIKAALSGVIIGKQNIPLAQEGEAIYHIAYFNDPDDVVSHIEQLQEEHFPEEMND
ncbi:succinylglutamate desuccinylase/aspartoacylase family protein [Aliikangiella sp. G2MR2-5]|uniref:succinylglutamate desuccinylase/aspartoacylase family protein n=1 Tax=Aliikangiella sp. G2MR2-5 TaxID=2788943 RepID=UPI0018A8B763|nr:succinylglutamate desuccinylase/aspartoacylase family protein [Aliikangiella sp. G2MR2-5]